MRAAVEDNVAKPGRPRATAQSARPAAQPKARSWTAVIVIGGLVLTGGALALRKALPRAEQLPVAARSATGIPSSLAPAATAPISTTFEAPVGIDRSVFPLAVHKVVVDAGHGGIDHGASNGTLSEKDLTLDIARRLSALLEAGGFEPILTRDDDQQWSLRERVQHANASRADLFVSIHVNWFATEAARGVETYYLGATDDPELMALAQRENRESGYSLSDLRNLLDGVYADLRQGESRRLAGRVQRSLYRSLLPISPELRDRGVKTAPFVVLVATDMPAILAEVSCLSNQQESERLARPRYRDHIAQALYAGIEAYVRDVNQTVEKGS